MRLFLITATVLLSQASFANVQQSEGYKAKLKNPNRVESEVFYTDSLPAMKGAKWECKKVATYSGGPKTGSWRTYFICKTK